MDLRFFLGIFLFFVACSEDAPDGRPAPQDGSMDADDGGPVPETGADQSSNDGVAADHVTDGSVDDRPPGILYPGLPESCQLPNRGRGLCYDSWAGGEYSWTFRDAVTMAVDGLDRSDTALFDPDGTVPPDRRPAFAAAISAVLDRMGICALWDVDELYVRSGERDYNETFRLFSRSWNPVVTGHYYCEPASSIPGAPLPVPYPAQGCPDPTYLPPGTRETTSCEAYADVSMFFSDVEAAVLEVIAAEEARGAPSLIFDFDDRNLVFQSGWENRSYRIRDDVYFLNAVAAAVVPRGGYCYGHNGFDSLLLKHDNSRSESYDLVQGVSCGEGDLPECRPERPSGDYVRYPGRNGECRLAEF